MPIINSYPIASTPTTSDLLLGVDTSTKKNQTVTFTVSDIVALASGGGGGGSITTVTSGNFNTLSVSNPQGATVTLTPNTTSIVPGGPSLATTGSIYTFVTGLGYTSNTGTVTSFSTVSTAIPGITTAVTNNATTPELTLSITGTPTSTQYLDGTGNWSTPAGSGSGTVESITATAPLTGGTITTTGSIGITEAAAGTDGYLSGSNFSTFQGKQDAITLTTNNTTGAATLVGSTLNIPIYASSGAGGGTVVSVSLGMPSAFTVVGSPITTSGTFTVTGAGGTSQYIDGTGALQTYGTDLLSAPTNSFVSIQSSTGTNASISAASQTIAGVMTAADKTKLDGLNSSASVSSVGTSNSTYITGSGGPVTSSGTLTYSLSATGTPSTTTFLRGDNTWAVPAGGGGGTYPFSIQGSSLYSGFVPSGLSGSPALNTVLGINAGAGISTQVSNTFIGSNAASGTQPGERNTVLGGDAFTVNTVSLNTDNVFIGFEAATIGPLTGITTGNNVAVGSNAMSGGHPSNSVAVGFSAMDTKAPSSSVAIGSLALENSQGTSTNIIAIGNRAAQKGGGSDGIFIGHDSAKLLDNTISNTIDNVFIGQGSGEKLTVAATSNVLIGDKVAGNATSSTSNIFKQNIYIGALSGNYSEGQDNVIIGHLSGKSFSPSIQSDQATIIGGNAGFSGYGNNCVIIGYGSIPSTPTATNEITIGNTSVNLFRIPGLQTTASNGDVLTYSSSNGGMILQAPSGGGGVTSVGATIDGDSIAISNSPITSSGTLTFAFDGDSSEYINGAGNLTSFPSIPGGTVTSVTATSPVTSSGGTTPVIAMPEASGLVSGYLSSLDYNLFANKIDGASTASTTTPTVIQTLTQAEYDALTPIGTTIYVIV